MFAKLKGLIDSINGNHVIVDVGGVGYAVSCSAHTLRQIHVGEAAALLIETQVREDAINLFGFADAEEQSWFRLLTTVQGVGAKVALSILSSVAPSKLAHTIAAQDKTALTQADGVGPKLALRIVTELKDKAPSFAAITTTLPAGQAATAPSALDASSAAQDAISALVNLGYRRAEAFTAIAQVSRSKPDSRLDELIRLGLSELTQGSKVA